MFTDFPEKKKDFEIFEQELFPVDLLISFNKEGNSIPYSEQLNPALSFIQKNKHLSISTNDINVLKSYLTKKTSYGFIFGA